MEGMLRAALLVLAALVFVLIVGALVFYYAEGSRRGLSLWDALYWAFITATTIGYGDIYPETTAGRAAALVVAVAGIASFTALVGLAAEALVEGATKRIMGLAEAGKRDHIVVLGYGPLTRALIDELRANAREDIVVVDENVPLSLGDKVTVIRGDILDRDVLSKAGVDKASTIIIDLLDDSRTLLAVLHVKRMNKSAKIIAVAVDESNVDIMLEAGARHVVPLSIVSMLAASYVYEPPVPEIIVDLASSSRGVLDLVVEEPGVYAGMEFCEAAAEMLRREGRLLLGLVRGGEAKPLPGCGETIGEGDKLLVVTRS